LKASFSPNFVKSDRLLSLVQLFASVYQLQVEAVLCKCLLCPGQSLDVCRQALFFGLASGGFLRLLMNLLLFPLFPLGEAALSPILSVCVGATWEFVRNTYSQLPTLLTQKLWGWGPASRVLTRSLGDLEAC
jgi:hypothetical protein